MLSTSANSVFSWSSVKFHEVMWSCHSPLQLPCRATQPLAVRLVTFTALHRSMQLRSSFAALHRLLQFQWFYKGIWRSHNLSTLLSYFEELKKNVYWIFYATKKQAIQTFLMSPAIRHSLHTTHEGLALGDPSPSLPQPSYMPIVLADWWL